MDIIGIYVVKDKYNQKLSVYQNAKPWAFSRVKASYAKRLFYAQAQYTKQVTKEIEEYAALAEEYDRKRLLLQSTGV